MERSELIIVLAAFFIISTIAAVTLWYQIMAIREMREIRRKHIENLKNLQDWLFNQLYTMAPGKVLKPDEIESTEESKPAKVINPNKDPYAEFKGKKNDWF